MTKLLGSTVGSDSLIRIDSCLYTESILASYLSVLMLFRNSTIISTGLSSLQREIITATECLPSLSDTYGYNSGMLLAAGSLFGALGRGRVYLDKLEFVPQVAHDMD